MLASDTDVTGVLEDGIRKNRLCTWLVLEGLSTKHLHLLISGVEWYDIGLNDWLTYVLLKYLK